MSRSVHRPRWSRRMEGNRYYSLREPYKRALAKRNWQREMSK